jgi:Ala-tRNA(Pro) deacylase
LHVLFSTQQITPATEAEFKFVFHDCEFGVLKPFGNLYDMEVLLPNHWPIRYLTFPAKNRWKIIKKEAELF